MKKRKAWLAAAGATLAAAIAAAALLGTPAGVASTSAQAGEAAAQTAAAEELSDRDTARTALADCAVITLNGTSAQTDAAGVVLADGLVTIEKAGDYALTGSFSGTVAVALAEEGKVNLLLNGASIQAVSGAAITVSGTSKTVVTLAEGTANALADGEATADAATALLSRDDLTINGTGSLTVSAQGDGITCRDTLKIVEGTLSLTCGDDGLIGKDAVIIAGGDITIVSQGDGIKATNTEDASRGYVSVSGGTITITTAGGHGSAAQQQSFGPAGSRSSAADTADAASAKGLKAVTLVSVTGGAITADTADDSIHSNGSVTVAGGTLKLQSGDDGIHADSALTVTGGDVDIGGSYEGFEAENITIAGGALSVTATDDGVNAAGGSDADTTMNGWLGQDSFSAGTGTLTITGGTLYVYAEGDGLDTNGTGVMSGGEVYVAGPTTSGNGALDYNDSFTVTGGTLVALDCGGMSQAPSSVSVAGMTVTLSGSGDFSVSDGANTLIRFAPGKSYALAVCYSDRLTDGASYTVSSDSASQTVAASTVVAQLSTGGFGGFGGGRGGWH